MRTAFPEQSGRAVLERTIRPAPRPRRQPAARPEPKPVPRSSPRHRQRTGRRLARFGAQWVRRLALIGLVLSIAYFARRLGLDSVVAVTVAVSAGLALSSLHRIRRRRRPQPVRLVVLAALLVALGSFTWSYTGYLIAPGAAATSVRTSDWMRDHGLSPVVDRLEQYLYNRHGPSNGPVSANELPTAVRGKANPPAAATPKAAAPKAVAATPKAVAATPRALVPVPVGGLIDHSLAGEGQWSGNARTVAGSPVTYTTFFRPDPAHTGVVAAAVWLDPRTTRLTYVPGTKDPLGGGWAWGSGVPPAQRPGLIAAFNGGFKFKDTSSGAFTEGRTSRPLVDGQASLVLYADGRAALGSWGNEVGMTPDVVTVRQNLRLVVDGGHPVPGLNDSIAGEWGTRRWQLQYTNRSGIGITDHGALVYVQGANLSTATLADALVKAGSVRAMELDIHASNPTFNFFTPAPGTTNGVTGTKLLPNVGGVASRFIVPDQRDFFAITMAGPVQR